MWTQRAAECQYFAAQLLGDDERRGRNGKDGKLVREDLRSSLENKSSMSPISFGMKGAVAGAMLGSPGVPHSDDGEGVGTALLERDGGPLPRT